MPNYTLEQFKAECPELFSEIVSTAQTEITASFEEQIRAINAKHEAEMEAKTKMIEGQDKRIKVLEKNDIIRSEKEKKMSAENIMDRALDACDIPTHLHDKVRSMVPYGTYVKDDVFDAEAYKKAVDAEIKDWEDRGIKTSVLGSGHVAKTVNDDTKTTESTEAEDETWVNDMVSRSRLPQGKK